MSDQDDFTKEWNSFTGFNYRNDIATHVDSDLNFVYENNSFSGTGGEEYFNLNSLGNSNDPLLIDLEDVLADNTFDRAVVVRENPIVPIIFTSIQDAIDVASDGDAIEVAAGNYEEALEILTDNLTLQSTDGAAATIIDAGGAINAIKIGEYNGTGTHPTGITIDGFTVQGWAERGIGQRNGNGTISVLNNTVIAPLEGAAVRGAIILSGGNGSLVKGNTLTIPEFGTEGWQSAGIMLLGTYNAIVEENSITGHPDESDIGIAIVGAHNWSNIDSNWETAKDNIIQNNNIINTGEGIAVAGDSQNTTITGNDLTENAQSIRIYEGDYEATPSGNTVIQQNKLDNLVNDVSGYNVDATCNWFGTDVFSDIAAKITGNVTWSPYLLTAQGPCGGFAPVANVTQGTFHITIQGAIDAAEAGDVIEVSPGEYVEEVTIDKPLTVLGATHDVSKKGYTVPENYEWDSSTESIIMHPDPSTGYDAIVDIYNIDDVTFKGFIVQELDATGNNNSSLVRARAQTKNISVNIENNVIGPNTNINNQNGTHGRMGLYLVNNPYDTYGIQNSNISGNKIFGCEGNGNNIFLWSSYKNYNATGPVYRDHLHKAQDRIHHLRPPVDIGTGQPYRLIRRVEQHRHWIA